jgi:Cu/Ag efflux pump CusA
LSGNETLGSAFSEMWSNLLYGAGSYRALRWVLAIILLIGIIWSGFMFKKVLDFSKPTQIKLPPAKNLAAQDAKRLEGVIQSFRSAVLARTGSSSIAVAAATSYRRPFVPTMKEPEPDLAADSASGDSKMSAEEMLEIMKQPEEVIPPLITVRAIMTLGGRANAVLDIENEGEAIVVKPGYTFGDGEGRVKRITSDKVIVTWAGEDLEIPAGM